MLCRALDLRISFGGFAPILDSLARASGLFPYAFTESLDTRDLIAYECHRPSNLPPDLVFHREQAEVYRRLMNGESIILSAPTSFGKSKVIDAVVASGKYRNLVIVVPTLALIDETRRRLSVFSDRYKIVTQISQIPAETNIFIFTAERVVQFEQFPEIDFFVVDEFYKLGDLEEDESRTVSLNTAFYKLVQRKSQFYMLGPNVDRITAGLEDAYRCVFFKSNVSTVAIDVIRMPGEGKDVNRLLSFLSTVAEPTVIYCSSPQRANEVARAMVNAGIGKKFAKSSYLRRAASWIGKTYHRDWIFGTGLANGVGIHHGRVPRSLAQLVVRSFNAEKIGFLICTSSLIEGVNTKAKNVIIWDNSIANRPLDYFTFSNIRGRSGRMFYHFVGRVYLSVDPPSETSQTVDFPLFTQDSTVPESLLIQLAPEDLSTQSADRIQKYSDQLLLPLNVLRANHGVSPESQLELARYIDKSARLIGHRLAWNRIPTYEQLKFACELIWEFLVDAPRRRQGIASGSQLAHQTWQLYQEPKTAKRIADSMKPGKGKYSVKDPDEAVEKVLQFERTWASFEFPRFLAALSSIQREVLSKSRIPFGNYSTFVSMSESLFRPPVVKVLDEYGIPPDVGIKLAQAIPSDSSLDASLAHLKRLDFETVKLTSFEEELVEDALTSI